MPKTSVKPIPEKVQKFFMCQLLHERRPILTGKIIWDEIIKEDIREIKWMCDICEANEIQHN